MYLSTDDPDGVCKHCFVDDRSCDKHPNPKPVGCPQDPSWTAFTNEGWELRFLKDFLGTGNLKSANPNLHGMMESIVCSRAKVFAGVLFLTY